MRPKLIVLDIDGVITDGFERLGEEEAAAGYKQISFQDLDAVYAARVAGFQFALLTAEDNAMVRRIASRFGIEDVCAGQKDKLQGIEAIGAQHQLKTEQICYIGDSDRDARAFPACGLSFTPANGGSQARWQATFTLHRCGGQGAVAEAIEIILKLNRMTP